MGFRDDERGVSELIGALFVFAILILLVITAQTAILPSQNEAAEFNHFDTARTDFYAAETAFANAAASGAVRQQTIKLGTTYPPRAILLNPAPPSGSLQSTLQGTYTFVGVDTIDGPDPLAADICGSGQAVTNTFEYRPNYNYLTGVGRLVFENRLAYQDVDNGLIWEKNTTLISGTDITLRPLNDDISTAGVSGETVEFKPGTNGSTTLTDGDTNSNFGIEFPSRLSADAWRDLLNAGSNPNVESVAKAGDTVTVRLDDSKSWDLQCTPVGLGETPSNDPDLPTTGGGGGGNNDDDPPTASINATTDTTSGNTAQYTVRWNATDDTGLANITVDMIDSSGTVVDTTTNSAISGTSATGTTTLSNPNGKQQRYVLKIIVTDSDGQTDTESVSDYSNNK